MRLQPTVRNDAHCLPSTHPLPARTSDLIASSPAANRRQTERETAMYVKIVRKYAGALNDGFYQCRRVFVRPDEENVNQAIVSMEDDNVVRGVTLYIDKRDTSVFILNDAGRTIDTYRWS
jgi:hypothetical protein